MIEPASNNCVPSIKKRTAVNAPLNATEPAVKYIQVVLDTPKVPLAHQTLFVASNNEMVTDPFIKVAAVQFAVFNPIPNAVVKFTTAALAAETSNVFDPR